MKKLFLILALFLSSLALAGAPPAHAADVCDFKSRVGALTAAQRNSALDDLGKLRTELRIRREFLVAAIACDEDNLVARKDELEKLPDGIKTLPAYQRLMEGFADASRHYGQQKENIPDLGLQGTKDFARMLASWREGSYAPLLAWADNFLLWAGNQAFFDKVSGRLTQVGRLAFSLKLVDQGSVADKFKAAQEEFKAAQAENDAARDALNQGQAETALEHIKASLQGLSQTYKVFFDLESALQKIIK